MFIFADMKIIRTIAAALLVAALSVPAFASEMKGDDENRRVLWSEMIIRL